MCKEAGSVQGEKATGLFTILPIRMVWNEELEEGNMMSGGLDFAANTSIQ